MSKRLPLAFMAVIFLAAAVGCGSTQVFVRPDAEPIDMSKEKMIIMPAVAYGFGSLGLNETELSAALFTGAVAAFGSNGISLEPIKPALESAGLDWLTRRMCWAAYWMTKYRDEYDFSKYTGGDGFEKVPGAVSELVGLVASKMGLDFKPRYYFALYLWAYGSGMVPGTAKCRVIACIYDAQKNLLHSCTYYTKTMAKDIIMVEAAKIPNDTFNLIMKEAAKGVEGEGEGDGEGNGDGE